jgi:uncharacterized Zn finger protein (UPF0148 family)
MFEGDEDAVGDILDDGGTAADDVTEQLVEEGTVVCWTCGSEVQQNRIEATLDELREVRRERLDAIRDVGSEPEDLKSEQRERETYQRRRETIDRKLQEIDTERDQREETIDHLRDEREQLNE